MDICFEKKCIDIFAERLHQIKCCTETVEAVVPDTNEDIARVATLRTMLLLKGKDMTARGILVSGEIRASLLYVTESGAVQSVQLSKEFSLDYESESLLDEKLSQVKLELKAAETRVLNPRKLSVSFEICGELRSYSREELCVSSDIGEAPCVIHKKYAHCSITPVFAVTEKTFAFTEQFSLPEAKPQPSALLSQSVDYEISDIQTVGGRAIIKGNIFLALCYNSEGVDCPLTAEFSCPFSQLVEVPESEAPGYAANIEINGSYFSIIDTISGEKAINLELHCLTELLCFGSTELSYIEDIYCNTAELSFTTEKNALPISCEARRLPLTFSESLDTPEDCSDVIAAFAELDRCAISKGLMSAQCLVDVLYRSEDGAISVMKRSLELEADCPLEAEGLLHMRIAEMKLYPTGGSIALTLSVNAVCFCRSMGELSAVTAAELDEDSATGYDSFPTLSAVRSEGESIWALAKAYRSSEEQIFAINGENCAASGEMLLIPKTK